MTTLLFKLAFAGIRSRLLASALTVAIAGAASATIVVALEVRSSGLDPWQQTFDAAHGAHVLAFVHSQADARALAERPGVTERSAPVPLVTATVGPRGSTDRVFLAGLRGRPAVNMPVLTAGSPLREGGIVLERSLANALGIEVGDSLAVTSRRDSIDLPVLGTAVVPSQPRYPRRNPGLAWVTSATLERVEPDRTRWRWTEALRLADPSAAAAFTERAAASLAATTLQSGDLETWQVQRDYALGDAQPTQVIVTMFTILLLIVAFVVVGILVGARASDQHREIGLLKAAGFTPRQVGAVFALESTALGLVAAALGFALGSILAPRLAAPSAETLLGSPTIAANPWHILVASCVVLPVLLAGALTSTRRSTRFSVLEAIRAGSSSPPNSRLARAVARSVLPLTVGLGLKDLLARGRRALLLAAAIVLSGAVVVVALSVDATLDAHAATGETSDIPDELPILIYTLDTALLLITVTTLVAVALLSVRERIREYGVLKAIGLTPGQITSTVIGAHAALALVASLLAVPLGVGLYLALAWTTSGTTEDAVVAPWRLLALIPIGTVLVVVAATGVPARLATRIASPTRSATSEARPEAAEILRPVEIAATDYHTAGEPFRIVEEGSVAIPGESVPARREYATSSDDVERVRRLLCHEPRGHADMYGGFIVPPDDDGADFGVLFWHKDGYSTACGHGTIALGAWAVESGRVEAPPDGEVEVRIDVPSGRVVARVSCRAGAVERVAFRNVPAYVIARDVPAGDVRVDVAYGGAIYAFVAAAELGLPLSADALPELIRAGREIKAALAETEVAVHPDDPRLSGIYGTVIHEQLGPAHHRNVVVFADGEVDRSPTGSATSARTALLADDGGLDEHASWRNDSIIGTSFRASVVGRAPKGILTEVEGTAFRTGEHRFVLDPRDDLGTGFVLR